MLELLNPSCVTQRPRGDTDLTVSDYFVQDTIGTATGKIEMVLMAESRCQHHSGRCLLPLLLR